MTKYGRLPAGFKDTYGDIDQATLDAAKNNQYSTLAQLQRNYQQSVEAFKRALAARGALQSGDYNHGSDQLATGYSQQPFYHQGNAFAGEVNSDLQNYLNVMNEGLARRSPTPRSTAEGARTSRPTRTTCRRRLLRVRASRSTRRRRRATASLCTPIPTPGSRTTSTAASGRLPLPPHPLATRTRPACRSAHKKAGRFAGACQVDKTRAAGAPYAGEAVPTGRDSIYDPGHERASWGPLCRASRRLLREPSHRETDRLISTQGRVHRVMATIIMTRVRLAPASPRKARRNPRQDCLNWPPAMDSDSVQVPQQLKNECFAAIQ